MIHSTRGIVLHYTKYAESSIISTIYTEELGRQSYIINQVRSKKNKGKSIFLQPLALLDLQVYQSPKTTLQRVKDFKSYPPLFSIPFDQNKRAIAFFIAEVLYKVLREEEENKKLFSFLFHSIELIDQQDSNFENFHLFFLIQLTRFLGIFPLLPEVEKVKFFDLKKGMFLNTEPNHPFFLQENESRLLLDLIKCNSSNYFNLKINRLERGILISKLIEYFSLHIENFTNIKSLSILKELFI